MKKLILPLLMLAVVAVKAQAQPSVPIDKESGHVEYTEVVNVDGTSADELYKRMYYWFRTYYTNPSSVVQLENKQTATIQGKHAIAVFDTIKGAPNKKGFVKYTIEVAGKDGRYRYKIKEIYFEQIPKLYIEKWLDPAAPNKSVQYNYVTQVDAFVKDLVSKLKDTMSKPVPTKQKDDF